MTIEFIKGNLLDAFAKGEVDIILHVVNCQSIMGSGIAKQIKDRYPVVFEKYLNLSAVAAKSWPLGILGTAQRIDLLLEWGSDKSIFPHGKTVVNLFAQDKFGMDKRHLNYGALGQTLYALVDEHQETYIPDYRKIGLPFKMGSDRAGGSWEIVLEMIEFFFRGYEVKIYQL